ncbi:transmembrane protein, putative (macronuclear) [Tetrahymena thermophila SB210]|uniref:Transmembrane protein, putative n=1 Tax=Tetrahymena thermophila (strain SB210) TaxID=312017 RepID=W7XCN5_TETTS|nr:transmembrane protein, putative [Tetrahymena thermophila SB210]EWS71546.1 transmembrane protein, putative [Tetrahymena thermophila SB210]|eukprot:XP_012655929.1 transmembrane protein, putative [Tetrahymena thermophila SB210]
MLFNFYKSNRKNNGNKWHSYQMIVNDFKVTYFDIQFKHFYTFNQQIFTNCQFFNYKHKLLFKYINLFIIQKLYIQKNRMKKYRNITLAYLFCFCVSLKYFSKKLKN